MPYKDITVHEEKFSTEVTFVEDFLNDFKLTIHLLVPGDLNAMGLEGVAFYVQQKESFTEDLAVGLAGVTEVVADLEVAGLVRHVLQRSCIVLLWLRASIVGTREGSSCGGALDWKPPY